MTLFADKISLKRRYHRSINLERDFENSDSLEGYLITPRCAAALERILSAITSQKLSRAWTLTGAYGTGKSSFAHFLLSLSGPAQDGARKSALRILSDQNAGGTSELAKLAKKLDVRGLVRAVITAQREPIAHSIVKALYKGCADFWSEGRGRKPAVLDELRELVEKLKATTTFETSEVMKLVTDVSRASRTGLVIVIDELGKNLEFSALRQSESDLYLLQQLAELRTDSGVYILGLLHQSFADYGLALSSVQRAEWSKVQGRFEDIPFTNSAAEALRLISHAIYYAPDTVLSDLTERFSQKWRHELTALLPETIHSSGSLANLLPLHPITSIALPFLCNRFAQNDRSLFTFLTSDEPHSFTHFLQNNEFTPKCLPTLKLSTLYDYFVDVVGSNLHSRPHLSRWLEIQGKILESHGLSSDELSILKAIGILNLIATAGTLRASINLVAASMCDSPDDKIQIARWKKVIQSMIEKRVIIHRRQIDELRIWEGTDFDIEQATYAYGQADRRSLDEILNKAAPLSPVVAQRHSYKFGTFRFFERRYVSSAEQLQKINSLNSSSDGVIAYWVSSENCSKAPAKTVDGKSLVVIPSSNIKALERAAHEISSLQKVSEAPELHTDGVARREVRQRILIARRHLDDVLADSFDFKTKRLCLALGRTTQFSSWRQFVSSISDICDEVYCSTPILLNELINRRELTSQGAKARRELLEALLAKSDQENLGLSGFGPEVSMYQSVLAKPGIHREHNASWIIASPTDDSMKPVWLEIEKYCLDSVDHPRSVTELFEILGRPPFGLKAGLLPVLFAAVLIHHNEDICIYRDGSFVPVLGPEHFELLVKDPSRFAVKHFVTTGLRAQIFKEIEELVAKVDRNKRQTRNSSLLGVVTPLTKFVANLPLYTRKTNSLSAQTKAVRDAIASAKQPDELLFERIPDALGLGPIVDGDQENKAKASELRVGLLTALRELQTAYEEMLNNSQQQLCEAFKITDESARDALRTRGQALSLSSGQFDSFVAHIIDEDVEDRVWFARLLMIIADKPTESWRDEDVELFKDDVVTYAKRFANFEAVQSNMQHAPGAGFQAKKITLTQPSGKEEQKILWIEVAKENRVKELVEEINLKLEQYPDLHDAILSRLTESLLANSKTLVELRKKEA